ncbi:MAG: glutamate synthase large subunit [Candidatus Omnitrophica bacterium]|nr:glutamate synthase large subunit [Candidatus Omnitrophota bacterium]MBD3269331.1 glutamate synthase large subunit [Candidatus Omnitrophota bacterium]
MIYNHNFPEKCGLYSPRLEHDSCGVGFVCNIKGKPSHRIITGGLKVLRRLAHRGAVGADPATGDGAGILLQIPHKFFRVAAKREGIELPPPGQYATGLIFLPTEPDEYRICKKIFDETLREESQILLGWRKVPVDNTVIGKNARESEPVIEQVFIGRAAAESDLDFERRLYIIRKIIENKVSSLKLRQDSFFYITNLSGRTFSYKGLLMPGQLKEFFLDLNDDSLESTLALVHSRYSTNTFPSWDLAQPFRFLAHNGEINTLRGNVNWMRAREGFLSSPYFKEKIDKIKPVITPGGSDSASIDNAFELLTLSGRSLPHVMMMLIPGAWENDGSLSKEVIDFYKFHACFSEPWDGPAAIAFTDGKQIGAVLDRNGLRPARYIVTRQDFVVMASEVGVLDIPPCDIVSSGRLEPGRIFFIDTGEGRIVHDREIKETVSKKAPYGRWLKNNLLELGDIAFLPLSRKDNYDVFTMLEAFGFTREDLKFILKPMAEDGYEPTGSMGDDTPLAVFSGEYQPLFNYFRQLFAQVTNPAIDPIREEVVMSLQSFIGHQANILEETPFHCRKLAVRHPVLSNTDLSKIKTLDKEGFKSRTISTLFNIKEEDSFLKKLDSICLEAEEAIKEECSFVILSDKGVNKEKAALPSLLAVGAMHQYLVKRALRTQIGIIVESAEPREVHHFALLLSYGADCMNPYLAYDSLRYLISEGDLKLTFEEALSNYRKAAEKGIKKILSKMGISTLQSYRGAQIFEALGLAGEVIDKCFTGTTSRIGGAGFKELTEQTVSNHRKAFSSDRAPDLILPTGGIYQWKKNGEFHLWNPSSITALQLACRYNDYGRYKDFATLINDQSSNPVTLRSILKFKKRKPVPLSEVEPLEDIFKRFATGAMSFGSISRGAHETLAIAMNRIGGKSNTGEGGEDPARFIPMPNGDSRRSAIKQVASGRFGVTINYLVNADELQIKIAQGAKPGEGGQLPGHKVSVTIAKTRYTTPGVTLISPPPHHDIYSIEDLAQLIFDLKNANPYARISVKLVSEVGVGTIAAGVAKGHADMILISGGDGGTGASPRSSIRYAGLPWELGLSETHQTLVLNDLRSRVRLQTDGQMRTGRDVAIAAMMGAEEYGFCTAALITMGCVMLRHCHLNNCSMGVATQDDILQSKFRGRAGHVVNYFHFVARELREIMAALGIRKVDEMIGRTDLLEVNEKMIPHKSGKIDYSRLLYRPKTGSSSGVYCQKVQVHAIDKVLDRRLIELCSLGLKEAKPVKLKEKIGNGDRTTGAMLSGEVVRRFGEQGLPEDTIHIKFEGIAGQSFGAWLAKGVVFELEGLANDYVGKGISGGKLIIYPGDDAGYKAEDNIIIGNTTFYGAISGEAYIRGIAGERFCIRNSGLNAVVEGVGDHGCEYMTGGRVLILGKTGRNFAAGMSGGIAYVYDAEGDFASRCNTSMVDLDGINDEDKNYISMLLSNHKKYTQSPLAESILSDFENTSRKFVKVIPVEYKRILAEKEVEKRLGLSQSSDG